MKQNGHKPSKSEPDQISADTIYRTIAEARGPLTAVSGCAQLLARRIRAGRDVSPEAVLETLTLIERSAWELEGKLREIEGRIEKPE